MYFSIFLDIFRLIVFSAKLTDFISKYICFICLYSFVVLFSGNNNILLPQFAPYVSWRWVGCAGVIFVKSTFRIVHFLEFAGKPCYLKNLWTLFLNVSFLYAYTILFFFLGATIIYYFWKMLTVFHEDV